MKNHQKKLMLLGGSRYLLPVIEIAHKLGIYVVTADYLPNNIAHSYSDEYCNVSVVDKSAVLRAATELCIDGIMSFACDPGVLSAAYVAEILNLPFQCSYESTNILQDKGKFRSFLRANNFNSPFAKSYFDPKSPYSDLNLFKWPVIVKPVDSAGSKGVTRVDCLSGLKRAIDVAIENSHNGSFLIEEFLIFKGYHSSADLFTVDGELKFVTYSDQLFDSGADNPFTPAMIVWPSTMENKYQAMLTKEIQRLMNLLKVRTGIYNVETCVDINGIPYIMEVSPRGGGCKIAEIQNLAYGVDLISNEVKKAVNMPLDDVFSNNTCYGYWCEMIVHSQKNQKGFLKNIEIDESVKSKYHVLSDISVKRGDFIYPFTGANMALGDMFFRFDSREELNRVMGSYRQWLHIVLE